MMKRIPFYLAVMLVPALALGTTIVNDSFTDLDRGKTGPLDADWWSSSSTSGNSVEIDANGLGLVTGTSGRGLHATFTPQTLAIGDNLTATFTFSTSATIGTGKSTAFRVALADFNDAGLAADLSSTSSSVNPLYVGLPAYMADFDVGTGTEDISMREHDVTSGLGRFMGTTGEWLALGSSTDVGYTFAPDTEYVGVISVTRTGADSVDLFASMSQGGVLMDSFTDTDSADIANNFGVLGFWVNSNTFGSSNVAGDADNGITFSNVLVEYTAIPEPSTSSLLLLGALLGIWRRRG